MGNRVTPGYETSRPLSVDINPFNVKETFEKLNAIEGAMERGYHRGIQELAERLEDKLKENILKYGLGDSEIYSTTYAYATDDGISIGVGTDYAVYVEFGTGIKGASSPHQNAWTYDVNGHGAEGWWYPTTASDPNKKKYFSKNKGVWLGWTAGQVKRPFMYDTWKWGRQHATQIIRKNIRQELKRVNGVR